MHLSIPKQNEKSLYHTIQYMKWSAIGIVGPELVLFAAWRQYVSAQALLEEVRATRTQEALRRPTKVSVASLISSMSLT